MAFLLALYVACLVPFALLGVGVLALGHQAYPRNTYGRRKARRAFLECVAIALGAAWLCWLVLVLLLATRSAPELGRLMAWAPV